MLFLLRSLRLALHDVRVEFSSETRRVHCAVIRMPPFGGLCPYCTAWRPGWSRTAAG